MITPEYRPEAAAQSRARELVIIFAQPKAGKPPAREISLVTAALCVLERSRHPRLAGVQASRGCFIPERLSCQSTAQGRPKLQCRTHLNEPGCPGLNRARFTRCWKVLASSRQPASDPASAKTWVENPFALLDREDEDRGAHQPPARCWQRGKGDKCQTQPTADHAAVMCLPAHAILNP